MVGSWFLGFFFISKVFFLVRYIGIISVEACRVVVFYTCIIFFGVFIFIVIFGIGIFVSFLEFSGFVE